MYINTKRYYISGDNWPNECRNITIIIDVSFIMSFVPFYINNIDCDNIIVELTTLIF